MSVRSGGGGEKEEPVLFCREANLCGAAVESQCYTPRDKTVRGSRVPTKHVCCHCYADSNLTRDEDAEDRETRGGRVHRPVCKSCLANGVPVVCAKRAKKNQVEASKEKRNRKSAGREAHLGRKKTKSATNF